MTDKLRQAAQQMLEAVADLTILTPREWQAVHGLKIDALRAALAEQPAEQEPQTEDVAADAYSHACDEMVRWQRKRRLAGKEAGTTGSLCDGIAWLYLHIDTLERTAMAEQPVEQGDDFSQCKPPMRHIPGVRVDLLRKAAAPEVPQPAKSAEQCWKCGDLDPAGHAKCNVPACGMREDTQPAKSAEQEPVEMSPEFTDTARAALAEPARMTPAELADRLKRGEKWQLAEQPAESLDGKLVMGLAVIRELTGTQKTDNIEATIEAVRKAVAPQPAIPQGYKLVPVEPTIDMLRSGVQRELADASHYGRLRDTYRAMLAAAPVAPQPAKQMLTEGEIDRALDLAGVPELPAGHESVEIAIAQRDELLAALKEAVGLIEMAVPFEGSTVRKARAAIAKAEGEKT